jgi:hypothetical protein
MAKVRRNWKEVPYNGREQVLGLYFHTKGLPLKINLVIYGEALSSALCYKSEGRWFDSRWCHWNLPLT